MEPGQSRSMTETPNECHNAFDPRYGSLDSETIVYKTKIGTV